MTRIGQFWGQFRANVSNNFKLIEYIWRYDDGLHNSHIELGFIYMSVYCVLVWLDVGSFTHIL